MTYNYQNIVISIDIFFAGNIGTTGGGGGLTGSGPGTTGSGLTGNGIQSPAALTAQAPWMNTLGSQRFSQRMASLYGVPNR